MRIDILALIIVALFYIPDIIHSLRFGKEEYRSNHSLIRAGGVTAECVALVLFMVKRDGKFLLGFDSLLQLIVFAIGIVIMMLLLYRAWSRFERNKEQRDLYYMQLGPACGMLFGGICRLNVYLILAGAIFLICRRKDVKDTLLRIEQEKEEAKAENINDER